MSEMFVRITSGEAIAMDEVPQMAVSSLRQGVIDACREGLRIAALFGRPAGDKVELVAILADDAQGCLAAGRATVDKEYDSITPDCPQAHWFEREIAEQWAVTPKGHPWLKPVRFHRPWRSAAAAASDAAPAPGVTNYFQVHGEEIHEVAVGPVHAGIIEPGHFRFQCGGEEVFHLEISLGYQHRGIEPAMVGGRGARSIHYVETAAGDTTVGHTSAYCQAIEALAHISVPARAQALRAVALELERLANHIGDLGALAGDVGFLPTQSFCGRIRGDALNMTACLCGNRFGRGLVRPGGTAFDADDAMIADLLKRLDALQKDCDGAVKLLWQSPSVMGRFEETGPLSAQKARELGLVGVPARACGLDRDVRKDHPFGMYRMAHIPASTHDSGDVFARAYVRALEIQRSLAFVREQLQSLPAGPVMAAGAGAAALAHSALTVAMTEGWRGEICHVAITDAAGKLARYKIVDPSLHNWFGLACALRGQQISDFPLCNKSFNLSYCGHDL